MPDALLDKHRIPVDAISGVADRIRLRVHERMGSRPYRVSIVTRTWSGEKTGEGSYTDEIKVLSPPPDVVRGGSNRFGPSGQEGTNRVTLREVSFSYTEAELYRQDLPANAEVVYMLERIFGGSPNASQEFFVVDNSPTPERGDKPGDRLGWCIKLHELEGFGAVDRVDA